MATAESPQTDPPKKKKLFKRTVPRKKPIEPNSESPELAGTEKSQDEPNDLDFFKQSKNVFPMVLQEVLEEKSPSPEKHDRKRRKVSVEPASATPPIGRRQTPSMSGSSGGRRKSSTVLLESESESDSDIIMDVKGKGKEIARGNKLPAARMLFSGPSKGAIGSMGENDDDDDDKKLAVSPVQRSQNDVTPGRRTRQSTRQSIRNSSPVWVMDEDIKPEKIARDSPDLEEMSPPEEDDQIDDEFSIWVTKAQEREAIQNPDATIPVIISSRIPGTKPLVVMRKLKQNVKRALVAWVDHQRTSAHFEIPEEQEAKLFLTWKGNKIYGESTPASLGVEVTEHGELKEREGEGYKLGKLHFQAWTEEDYAEYLEYKERERAMELGLLDDDGDALEAELEAQYQPPAKKKGIKVILKTKEFDALNTTVHDDTTVGVLISVFRSQRGVGLERSIEIWLDGERLEDESLVTDADIDPDEPNQLEVHIK